MSKRTSGDPTAQPTMTREQADAITAPRSVPEARAHVEAMRRAELLQCEKELNALLERYAAMLDVVQVTRLRQGQPVVAYQIHVVGR